MSVIQPLLLFLVVFSGAAFMFWVLPVPRAPTMILEQINEAQLVIDGGKELSSIVSIHISLCTGMFVAIAFVAKEWTTPKIRCPEGRLLFLVIFVLAAAATFFLGIKAKYLISDGILAKKIDRDAIGDLLSLQAWTTLFAASATLALVGDALLNFRGDHE